jgi:hypothetical protein
MSFEACALRSARVLKLVTDDQAPVIHDVLKTSGIDYTERLVPSIAMRAARAGEPARHLLPLLSLFLGSPNGVSELLDVGVPLEDIGRPAAFAHIRERLQVVVRRVIVTGIVRRTCPRDYQDRGPSSSCPPRTCSLRPAARVGSKLLDPAASRQFSNPKPLPRLQVAFDTNVYRGIADSRFDRLRHLERNHSVIGVASYWVAAELLSHLASPSDPDLPHALSALRRLVRHCRQYDGSQPTLPFIGDVYSQVAFIVFGRRLPDTADNAFFAALVGAVADEPGGLDAHRESLTAIAEQVSNKEAGFAENIWQNIIVASIPEARTWGDLVRNKEKYDQALAELDSPEAERLTAAMLVDGAVEKMGITLSGEDREAKVDEVLRMVPRAVRIHNGILRSLVRDSRDLSKPWNSNTLWDIHIAFCASTFVGLGARPLWLVTNDRPILRAARDTGMDWAIRSLDEYERCLQEEELQVHEPHRNLTRQRP